jgi:hypothetical protein
MANPSNPTPPGQAGQPPGQTQPPGQAGQPPGQARPPGQPMPPGLGGYVPPGHGRPEQVPATAAQVLGITGKPTEQKDKKPGEQTDQPGGGASPMQTYHMQNPETGMLDVAQLTDEQLADAKARGEEWAEGGAPAAEPRRKAEQPAPGGRR